MHMHIKITIFQNPTLDPTLSQYPNLSLFLILCIHENSLVRAPLIMQKSSSTYFLQVMKYS